MATVYQPLAERSASVRPVQAQKRSPVPIYLAGILVYLLLIPEQLHPTLFDFYLPPHRIFMFPAAIYLFASTVTGRARFVWPDLMIILATAWIWLASYMTSGSLLTTINMGGSHMIEIAMAYFLARAAIQTPRDLRLFLLLITPGVAFVGLLVVQEAVTHTRILQRVAADMTGAPYRLPDDTRLGFMRGAGPFPHPIHAGIFLASFLPIYLASGLKGWPKMVGLAASVAAFFSMSSAALLGLLIGGLFCSYDWLTEKIANATWRLFLFGAAIAYTTVELVSNSGFYTLVIRYASLNTATAYNRVHIWNFGVENVLKNPWFGLGYDDWVRPIWMHSGSFDHYWLLMALRFGIPASVLLVIATVAAVALVGLKASSHSPSDARLLRGLAISLTVFAIGASSVSLWLAVMVWLFMLVGMAVSLGTHTNQFRPVYGNPHPRGQVGTPPRQVAGAGAR